MSSEAAAIGQTGRFGIGRILKSASRCSRIFFESLVKGEKSIFWTVDTRTELIVGVHWENIKQPFQYDIAAADPMHAAGVSLLFLLVHSGVTPERFRKCPECEELFLLFRKPDSRSFYCSRRCAGRVATRNFRTGKRERIKPKTKIQKPRRIIEF
jgi:hypothetical protein